MLHNKTSKPLTVDWNRASLVDASQAAQKIMHSGVRYIDRDKPQPPTVVPPGAKLEDVLVPISNVRYVGGNVARGWSTAPFLPDGREALPYKGRSLGVLLPIESDGKVENYHFVILIEDVQL